MQQAGIEIETIGPTVLVTVLCIPVTIGCSLEKSDGTGTTTHQSGVVRREYDRNKSSSCLTIPLN